VSAPEVRQDWAPCLAVVGMHRSGTSATAGLLIGLGLDGPREEDLIPADTSNERGHWESESVHQCNAHILTALGATSYAPPVVEPGWETQPRFDAARREAAQWFTSTSSGRPLVLKDPRLCLTLPLWRTALPARLGAVLVLRDPMEVARSLQARDHIPVMLGLAMWDRYLRSAASGLAGLPSLVVEYDAMLANPVKATESMSDFLEQQLGVKAEMGTRDAAAGRLDAGLRHQDTERDEYDDVVRPLRDVYGVLAERRGSHEAWQPPVLPPAPPWVDDVVFLRREFASAVRELYWIKESRAYRLVSGLWRLKGGGASPLEGPASGSAGAVDRETL
jgi:hypothetical protein